MGCSRHAGISIEDAWIPEAPSTVRALAGYMVIQNSYRDPITLMGAESPFFEYVEIHRSIDDEKHKVSRMIKQEQVKIPSGQVFKFQPGEYHLMLMHPKQLLSVNQSVPVILTFNNGQQLEAGFLIRKHRLKLETDSWF